MSKYQQDEAQLIQLKTGDRKVWKQFFDEHLEPFQLFVMKYGRVSKEESFGLFQDAMVILHRNVSGGKLSAPLQSKLQTYLFAVGKNLCRRKPGSGRLQFPEHLPELPEYPQEDLDNRNHNAALVKSLLARIGEKCRQFLTLLFLDETPQEEIMAAMAIPSNEAFRKRKFDCLKKMRKVV